MGISILDKHVARKKLVLKDVNTCISFFSTLYKGEVIMLAYDNLNNNLMNYWAHQDLSENDVDFLQRILREY